jgi:hypothetical protein
MNKELRRGGWWVFFGVIGAGILFAAVAHYLGYKQ